MSTSSSVEPLVLFEVFGQELTSQNATLALFAVCVTAFFLLLVGRARHPKFLKKDEFQSIPLVNKETLSHDTRRFTFALPSPNHQLGLPVGQHVTLKYFDTAEGKNVQRSYTPVTPNDTYGKVSFVIKVYKAGVHPKFPNGGKLSQHLDSLSIGDTMEIKGPKGHLEWLDNGDFTVKKIKKPLEHRYVEQLNLIAGGTGITPMLQILHQVFGPESKDVTTKIKLLYANQSPDDILVRDELERLAADHSARFQLHYTVDKVLDGTEWKYSTGFVNKKMMQDHLFTDSSSATTQTFMCGPPPMVKFACLPALTELGFTEAQWDVL